MMTSEQLDMFGEPEPPPKPTDRIFFAIMPDAGAIADIRALTTDLKAQHGMRGRPIAEAKLHASSYVLGDFPVFPAARVEQAQRAAALVAAATPAFVACFDRVQTFISRRRDRPFVLVGSDGVIGVSALYKNLMTALVKAGLPPNPGSFTPHITLLYDEVTVAPQGVAPIEWTVRELVLLHSHIDQGKPYKVLHRWPLQT